MNAWQEATVLMLIIVLGVAHADQYEMSPPLAFTIVIAYLWLIWVALQGIWNFLI